MEINSACRMINQLVYKPQWSFEATDFANRFEGAIQICVRYPAAMSERAEAEMGYPKLFDARANFTIQVEDCDEVMLYRRLLTDVIFRIERHEAREFLRVLPTYWAPFHPHRMDGMKRWGEVELDLHFGLA